MNEVQLGPTAQQVLTFMQSHPKDVFAPEDLAEQLDCTSTQIAAALETLCRHNVIEQTHTIAGRDEYRIRR